jgi:hypothetical protein
MLMKPFHIALAALAALGALSSCGNAEVALSEAQPATGASLEKFSKEIHREAAIGTHAALVQRFCMNMSGAACPPDTPGRLSTYGFTDGQTGVDLGHAFVKMAADEKDGTPDQSSTDGDFIIAAYRVVLAREPDPGGAAHYAQFLAQPGENRRGEMMLVFLKSPEFLAK